MGNKKTKIEKVRLENMLAKRREKKAALHHAKILALKNNPERVEKERQKQIRHYLQMNFKGVKMVATSEFHLKRLNYDGQIAGGINNAKG